MVQVQCEKICRRGAQSSAPSHFIADPTEVSEDKKAKNPLLISSDAARLPHGTI